MSKTKSIDKQFIKFPRVKKYEFLEFFELYRNKNGGVGTLYRRHLREGHEGVALLKNFLGREYYFVPPGICAKLSKIFKIFNFNTEKIILNLFSE